MLDEFIKSNRDEIIARTRERIATRAAPRPTVEELAVGVPIFLDQLVERLRNEGPSSGDMTIAAATHGKEMLQKGFTVAQVVQDYGDICQAITALAIDRKASITTEEFRTLNRCLDVATADAVSEYERQRDELISNQGTEQLGFLAHELRNLLSSAFLSFEILKRGNVGIAGSTGAVLGRSLNGLRDLVDRTLAQVRLEAGLGKRERVRVSKLIEEIEVVAAFEADNKGREFIVVREENDAEVEIDRHLLASALGNLLQNAFKFTHEGGRIVLRTRAADERVLLDIEDECGGLPAGRPESLFRPFEQRSADRSGLGLGLAISRRGVEASGGTIRVRDIPGTGCVFTIDLPRAT